MKRFVLRKVIMSLGISTHVYIGKNMIKKNQSIGIYHSKHSRTYRGMVDKKRMNGHGIEFVTLLVHWNDLQEETKAVSKKVYELLSKANEVKGIKLMHPLVPEPIDVGCDSKGIYEMVIEVAVIYRPWWNLLRFING